MTLRASIERLQNTGIQTYRQMAQWFSENVLIRQTWAEMAQDVDKQAKSLDTLPRALWTELKTEEGQIQAALSTPSLVHVFDSAEDKSLRRCLINALDYEEPLALQVYAPILRHLRSERTAEALDFYILAKSHMTRLLRIVHLFSGDPQLINRSGSLLASFEREIQLPEEAASPAVTSKKGQSPTARLRARAVTPARAKKVSKEPARKHSKTVTKRRKSLKIEIPRRRARR